MGGAKRAQMEHEDNIRAATSYLVQKGLLDVCEKHDEVYGGIFDIEKDFWPKAVWDWKQKERGLVPWAADMPVKEFTDLLTEAYGEYCSDECGSCEHERNDDS